MRVLFFVQSSLMREFGYPMETHFVDTQDGHRLRLERAPNPGRQPVLVAHGMQTASPCFVLLGRDKALGQSVHPSASYASSASRGICIRTAFVLKIKQILFPVPKLHDAGFDVWMINFRGTHFSLGHRKYTTRDEEFWNFRCGWAGWGWAGQGRAGPAVIRVAGRALPALPCSAWGAGPRAPGRQTFATITPLLSLFTGRS